MKVELVSPGGSLEKMEYAYHFGADAVYVGHPNFSLRARINEFTEAKLRKAVEVARKKKKKIYFTLNIFPHERHLPKLKKHLRFIAKTKPDALIVSDPGIISLAKRIAPKIRIHLSTQANTTNSEAVKFWQRQGVSRIILAREVTLEEIKKIRKACPKIELEYFVHGAMCMSYSGRCLLSGWMRGRSANLGDCIQPCRWTYKIKNEKVKVKNFGVPQSGTVNLNDEKNRSIFIEEDARGTYLLNSKDLCLIEYLEKLREAGINSFKIEGRTKSVFYVAAVTNAYRQVISALENQKDRRAQKNVIKSAKLELLKVANRGYSTGFLFGRDRWENNLQESHAKLSWQFVGEIFDKEKVKVHNALKEGDKVEIVSPDGIFQDRVKAIRNAEGERLKSAHGGSKYVYEITFENKYDPKSLLRKKIS